MCISRHQYSKPKCILEEAASEAWAGISRSRGGDTAIGQNLGHRAHQLGAQEGRKEGNTGTYGDDQNECSIWEIS